MTELITWFVDIEANGTTEDYLYYIDTEIEDITHVLSAMNSRFSGTRHEDFHLLGVF